MAYNRKNQLKKIAHILELYRAYKHDDVPDTHIVRVIFPKHNIHISYRTWVNYKGTVIPKNADQLRLFD